MPSYTITLNASGTRVHVTEWEYDEDDTKYPVRNLNIPYNDSMTEDDCIAEAKRRWGYLSNEDLSVLKRVPK